MTNREKIAAMIEPYSLTDEAVESAFLDSMRHFGRNGNVDDEFTSDVFQPITLAAMILLAQVLSLVNENIDGVSQSYNKDIRDAIKAKANIAGLSASLVLDDDGDNYNINSPKVW